MAAEYSHVVVVEICAMRVASRSWCKKCSEMAIAFVGCGAASAEGDGGGGGDVNVAPLRAAAATL